MPQSPYKILPISVGSPVNPLSGMQTALGQQVQSLQDYENTKMKEQALLADQAHKESLLAQQDRLAQLPYEKKAEEQARIAGVLSNYSHQGAAQDQFAADLGQMTPEQIAYAVKDQNKFLSEWDTLGKYADPTKVSANLTPKLLQAGVSHDQIPGILETYMSGKSQVPTSLVDPATQKTLLDIEKDIFTAQTGGTGTKGSKGGILGGISNSDSLKYQKHYTEGYDKLQENVKEKFYRDSKLGKYFADDPSGFVDTMVAKGADPHVLATMVKYDTATDSEIIDFVNDIDKKAFATKYNQIAQNMGVSPLGSVSAADRAELLQAGIAGYRDRTSKIIETSTPRSQEALLQDLGSSTAKGLLSGFGNKAVANKSNKVAEATIGANVPVGETKSPTSPLLSTYEQETPVGIGDIPAIVKEEVTPEKQIETLQEQYLDKNISAENRRMIEKTANNISRGQAIKKSMRLGHMSAENKAQWEALSNAIVTGSITLRDALSMASDTVKTSLMELGSKLTESMSKGSVLTGGYHEYDINPIAPLLGSTEKTRK